MSRHARRYLTALAAAVALGAAGLVMAAPRGVAPYGDPDVAARPFATGNPLDARQLAVLDVRIADQPSDVAARSLRGWLLAHRGERARALADLDAAIEAAAGDARVLRQVLWSAGWAAIALGDGALANDYWDRNLELVDARPFWVPYSRAVAYALLDDLDAAVQWYDLAAGVQPQRFATREGLTQTTRHWQPAERRLIDRVFAQWDAKRAATVGVTER
jgi:tetratricopeptide (TPR) repeat protein